MMTYDDRGEGGLQNDDVINEGSFLEQYPKKDHSIKNSTSFSLLTKIFFSFFFVNVFQTFYLSKRAPYCLCCGEKKYTLNEGGGSLKDDASTME